MSNRRTQVSKACTITEVMLTIAVLSFIASQIMVLADGGLDREGLATEISSGETHSKEESAEGYETSTAKTEEVDLRHLEPRKVGQFETTKRFEVNSRLSHNRQTLGEETSYVAVVKTLGDVTRSVPVVPTSVQGHLSQITERALPKHSSSVRNRESISGFRQVSQALQPETIVVSSFKMENLSPRSSSRESYAPSNDNPSSFSYHTVKSSSRAHLVTLSSFNTSSKEALSKTTSTGFRQSPVFTEKTVLPSAVYIAPSFISLSRSNFGQANHASQPASGSTVGLLLSHLASRQNLSSGMKQESRNTEGQKHQTAHVLTKEALTATRNKLLTRTSFRVDSVEDVTGTRPTPAAVSFIIPTSSTLPDRSRKPESSGKGMSTPFGIEQSISTTILSRIPLLQSSPVVAVERQSQFSRNTVTLLVETTKVIETRSPKDTAAGMMTSIIDYPSSSSESGVISSSAKSTQLTNDKATLSKQISRSRFIVTASSVLETSKLIPSASSLVSKESVTSSATTTAFPSPETLHTSLANSVDVSSSKERIKESSRSQVLLETPSATSVAGTIKLTPSVRSSTSKVESSTTAVLQSREGLRSSLLSSVVVSSTTELLLMSLKSRLLLATSPATLVRETTRRNKVSKSSTTTVLPSSQGLNRSLPSVIHLSSTTKLLLLSSKSQRFIKSRPTSSVRGAPTFTFAETMNLSQTVKTNQASSSIWKSSVNVSALSPLKSPGLRWVTGSTTAASTRDFAKFSATTAMNVSRGEATSAVGSHSHSSTGARIVLGTTSYQHSFASAPLSVESSSAGRRKTPVRVGSAALNSQSSSTILTTAVQPGSRPSGMSSSNRQVFSLSSRTTIFSSLSRVHGIKSDIHQRSDVPKPSSASTIHQSSSSTWKGIPPSPSLQSKMKKQTSNANHMIVLIVVATVPSVFLGIIIGILVCRFRGRNRKKGTHYSIKVEYTDEVRRRRKRTNSRLDLAVYGIHIDLEFPSSAEVRDSVRVSRGTHLNEGQIRELQLLSKACNQRLEWLNEVLAKDTVSPFSGTDSGILFRDSTFQSGGKIVRRESSRRSRENFILKRLFSRDKDSPAEWGDDSKKESTEFKALPTASENTPEEAPTGRNCEGAEGCKSKKEVKEKMTKDETEEEDPAGGEREDKNTDSPSSGNKMRFYPLARTRKETTRTKSVTL